MRATAVLLLALAARPGGLLCQTASPASPVVATAFLERYHEILGVTPLVSKSAVVSNLVLQRDAGRLTLASGRIYLLTPVGGRTIGAVFYGDGRFSLAPTNKAEQEELRRFAGASTLDVPCSDVVMIFADSTMDALDHLTFEAAPVPDKAIEHVDQLTSSLKGDNEGSYDGDLLEPFLNGAETGLFLARIETASNGPLLFRVDPSDADAVQLSRPARKSKVGANWTLVTQSPLAQPLPGTAAAWIRRERLTVPFYRMDVRLTPTFSAGLDFVARVTLTLKAAEPIGPWLDFYLDPRLIVDSAHWEGGAPAMPFRAKDDDELWVKARQGLGPGDSLALTVFYHGPLVDRYGNWFFINPLAAWFPVNAQGTTFANFDITFHSPSWYPIASVGERTDSSVDGKVLTTRWVTRRPSDQATFNLGLFESWHTQLPGAPPLDVFISEKGHNDLAHAALAEGVVIPEQRNMRENVAADVTNSWKLFTHLFGDCLDNHFYVTEIPYGEGVSFPGMVDLAWSTFQNTSFDGFDEWFRAHEMAHQWWGIGVRPGSYREAWLSEGLASFSALWYLQSERKHNNEYFSFLEQYRKDIKEAQSGAGPILVGYRAATLDAPNGYDVMIYEKGAWVFHMLRVLMLDLRTMKEDRFSEMMRDYYTTFRGGTATTADFQTIVERHMGASMDWFFDEWLRATGIPSYHVLWKAQGVSAGQYIVRLQVNADGVPADFHMPVLISADLGSNHFAHFRIDAHGGTGEYASPLLPTEPQAIKFNDVESVLADVKVDRW